MSRPVSLANPPDRLVGRLFVVGTPIGNLGDITFRAIEILKEVDLIACEDTRQTQKLLNHYSIQTKTISYHQHNEMTRAAEMIIRLEEGSQIALVSDAGMPGISDPGFHLVHLAIRHEIPVIPIPGASAIVAALVVSGLQVDQFLFLGFLPPKRQARQKELKELESVRQTVVFYESPHRIMDMLEDVKAVLGDRRTVVAREVTKIHEEFIRGSVSQVLDVLKIKPLKGEITVLVGPHEGATQKSVSTQMILTDIERVIKEEGMDERDALKVVARRRGISKSEAYRQWQAEKSRASRSDL